MNICFICKSTERCSHREQMLLPPGQRSTQDFRILPISRTFPPPFSKTELEKAARENKRNCARKALRNAVTEGLVIKPQNCEQCGLNTKIVGHHDDYSKPLKVRWLCYPCHGQLHAQWKKALKQATKTSVIGE